MSKAKNTKPVATIETSTGFKPPYTQKALTVWVEGLPNFFEVFGSDEADEHLEAVGAAFGALAAVEETVTRARGPVQ